MQITHTHTATVTTIAYYIDVSIVNDTNYTLTNLYFTCVHVQNHRLYMNEGKKVKMPPKN